MRCVRVRASFRLCVCVFTSARSWITPNPLASVRWVSSGFHHSIMSSLSPLRLRVNGSTLLDPSGNPMRLTGFNWQLGRTGPSPGLDMQQFAPKANLARLVGVLWGNTDPLQHHPNKECMTYSPPNYFNDDCFADLDPWVKSATLSPTANRICSPVWQPLVFL